ncbi:MAG: hypothetical protein HQL14_00420 [Candidatus Omnitrophica bacterium]|nr:hypothetical protein [Candidatus Omnitrophota bacterium]
MFSIFNGNPEEKQLRKVLFAFLAEMENNLELFYVMDQRQFISHAFLNDAWPLVCDLDLIKRHESLRLYACAVKDFNHSFKAYKEYEDWYAKDIKNRSTENARKLHALKNDLDERLGTMEALIIPAGQDLEREMLQLGFLNHER